MRDDYVQKQAVQVPMEQEGGSNGHLPFNSDIRAGCERLQLVGYSKKDCLGKKNLVKRGPKKSGKYYGVSYRRANRKWIARIIVGNHEKYLGQHDSAKIAAKVYDTWAKRFHGPRATLNFP